MSFSKESYAGNSNRKLGPTTQSNPKKECLLATDSNHLKSDPLNDGSTNRIATIEDQLKRDCSFFYQEMREDGRNMKSTTSTQQQQRQQHRISSTSSLAAMSRRRVMSSRDSSNFMNRYEQLNQEISFDSEGDDDSNVDLEHYRNVGNSLLLSEQGDLESSSYHQHNLGPTNNVVTDGLKTSSLFYEQDGRVLMRLPRDMVKLIMDHDLEPGILSVEQWRRREDVERQELEAQQNDEKFGEVPMDPLMLKGGGQRPQTRRVAASSPSSLGLSDLPELHYVITVPDDLYQRVVSEISMEVFPPYWGFFKCCNHESERADIKLALAILFVVLFLLMIGSIEWPTD
jgi:hypothetical protein